MVHEVIHAFLFAEFTSLKTVWKKHHIPLVMKRTCQDINVENTLNTPNFNNFKENECRYRALMSIRREIWFNLPPDMEWLKLQLTDIDFKKVILLSPKTEKDIEIYKSNFIDLTGIILIKEDEYYYVIEGNHRISGYIFNKLNKIIHCKHIFVGKSIMGLRCPLVRKGYTKLYAEKNLRNHWSQLYEDQKHPDINRWK